MKERHQCDEDQEETKDIIYSGLIASTFISESGKIKAKNLSCNDIESNLQDFLKLLEDAIKDLMDCILGLPNKKNYDAGSVAAIDVWRSLRGPGLYINDPPTCYIEKLRLTSLKAYGLIQFSDLCE